MFKRLFSTQLIGLLVAVVGINALIFSCGKPEDLAKDLTFKIDGDILRMPLSLQFVDANSTAPKDISEVEVEVVGPDAAKLYTTALEKVAGKTLKIKGGVLDFTIKKSDAPTPTKPMNFTVIARSTGFLKTVKNITLRDTPTIFQNMVMINTATPPQGVKILTGTATATAAGTTTLQTIGAATDPVQVKIPQGTVMRDASGNVLSGSVSVQLVQYSPSSQDALLAFPGGMTPSQIKDETGNSLGAGEFKTAGLVSIDMMVGNTEVKKFTGQSIQVSMNVESTVVNPETNKPMAVGDKVPLWSMEETTGVWQKESTIAIGGTANALKADFSASHLTPYNLDYFWFFCQPLLMRLPSNTPTGWYFTELVDANTGSVANYESGQMEYLYPNKIRVLQGTQWWGNRTYYLKIYNGGSFGCRGDLLYRTDNISGFCVNGSIQNVAIQGQVTLPVLVGVRASGTCPQRPEVVLRPNLGVYYKKTGQSCPYWVPLGTMTGGTLQTNVLKARESYDFKIVMGNQVFIFTNRTMPAELGSSLIFVDIPNISLPESLCAGFL